MEDVTLSFIHKIYGVTKGYPNSPQTTQKPLQTFSMGLCDYRGDSVLKSL